MLKISLNLPVKNFKTLEMTIWKDRIQNWEDRKTVTVVVKILKELLFQRRRK